MLWAPPYRHVGDPLRIFHCDSALIISCLRQDDTTTPVCGCVKLGDGPLLEHLSQSLVCRAPVGALVLTAVGE